MTVNDILEAKRIDVKIQLDQLQTVLRKANPHWKHETGWRVDKPSARTGSIISEHWALHLDR